MPGVKFWHLPFAASELRLAVAAGRAKPQLLLGAVSAHDVLGALVRFAQDDWAYGENRRWLNQTLKRSGQMQGEEAALETELGDIVTDFMVEAQTLQARGSICLSHYHVGALATMALYLALCKRAAKTTLSFWQPGFCQECSASKKSLVKSYVSVDKLGAVHPQLSPMVSVPRMYQGIASLVFLFPRRCHARSFSTSSSMRVF